MHGGASEPPEAEEPVRLEHDVAPDEEQLCLGDAFECTDNHMHYIRKVSEEGQ